jgi:Tfp pilus assembly protein PilO
MKLTQEQQYLIIGAVGVVLLGYLYFQFLLKPVWNEISSLKVTLSQKKKDLDDAKAIVAKYPEFKKRAATIQRELEWFQNRIPASLDRPKMLEAASFLQSRSQVSLVDFRANKQPVTNDRYTEVPVEVKFNSDYAGLLEFIHQMGFADTLMTVSEVHVAPYVYNSTTGNPTMTTAVRLMMNGIQAKTAPAAAVKTGGKK